MAMRGKNPAGGTSHFFARNGAQIWDANASAWATWNAANHADYRIVATAEGDNWYTATAPSGTTHYTLHITGADLAASPAVWAVTPEELAIAGDLAAAKVDIEDVISNGNAALSGQLAGLATEANATSNKNAVLAGLGGLQSASQAEDDKEEVIGAVEGVVPSSPEEFWGYGQRTLTNERIVLTEDHQFAARSIIRGNAYGPGARPFLVTIANAAPWPTDLSLYTWKLTGRKSHDNEAEGSDDFESDSVAVTTATGDSRCVQPAISAAKTGDLAPGLYEHSLRGVLISDATKIWTIELGTIEVKDDPAA